MKHRLIAILLILLLVTAVFATGVFAAPDTEPEDPVVTEPPADDPVTTEAPAPSETEAPDPVETEPAETSTEAPTEPQPTEAPQTEPTTPPDNPPADDPEEQPEVFCTLTITRPTAVEDHDFLYTILGGERSVQVILPGGSTSVTVKGLRPGAYQVREDRSWSWRYNDETDPENDIIISVNFTDSHTEETISFHTELTVESWLSGSARGDGR